MRAQPSKVRHSLCLSGKLLVPIKKGGRRSLQLIGSQSGVALVMALISLMLVSMLASYGAVGSQTEVQIAKNEQDAKRAFDIAEAGIRHALGSLGNSSAYSNGFNDELSNNGTGGAMVVENSTEVIEDGITYRFVSFGGGAADGYYIRAVDNNDDADQSTDVDQRILLVSKGRIGNAEKEIEALINPPVPCALTTSDYTEVSGNFDTANLVINTLDGNGACVHTNDDLHITGNPSFPDGATASGDVDCNGSPLILTGGCENAQDHQTERSIPIINVGSFAKWVAALGAADTDGRYFILHTKATPSSSLLPGTAYSIGQISRGGTCVEYDTSPTAASTPSSSLVGFCSGGALVDSSSMNSLNFVSINTTTYTTFPPDGGQGGFANNIEMNTIDNDGGNGVMGANYGIFAANGGNDGSTSTTYSGSGWSIAISSGQCQFSGTIPAGVYYCDGAITNSGQINGAGVTLIARDNIDFSSQTNLTPFFSTSNPIAVATSSVSEIGALADGTTKTNAQTAYGNLDNVVIVAGADLAMTGNNTVITGIVLVHNEVLMNGGKTITGYIIAANGTPTFSGNPHPASMLSQPTGTQTNGTAVAFNDVTGNNQINYKNFTTLLPLGPPSLLAWSDGAH